MTIRGLSARGNHVWTIGAGIIALAALPVLAQRGTAAGDQTAPPPGDAASGRALVGSS